MFGEDIQYTIGTGIILEMVSKMCSSQDVIVSSLFLKKPAPIFREDFQKKLLIDWFTLMSST